MANYNELQATDTMVVNNGESSYSVTVDNVATGENLQDSDLFLVNRGDKSYSITKQQLSEEIGASGEIAEPVVIISPADGAGMAPENATPAAEGITGVVESGDAATLTYTTDKSLDLLTAGQSMSQVPAYSPQTDLINKVETTSAWNQDQDWSTSLTTTGMSPESGSPMVDAFDGNLNTFVRPGISPIGMLATFPAKIMGKVRIYASVGGSAFLKINGTDYANRFPDWQVPNQTDARAWVDLSDDEDGIESFEVVHNGTTISYLRAIEVNGQILVDTGVGGAPQHSLLTFDTPKDIVNFRPGDVVQTEGTGNAAWNETQAWSNGWTDDSTFFSAGAEAYRGGKFACFSSANDKATTCDIYSGANSRIEWNGNVSGDNITIKFYKERQATLGYVLNGVEQLVTDEVGWESPTTKNLGNGVLTQLFAENNAGTSAGFFSVVVDGKVLVDPTNIYSVVSTDAFASKMTVDGGNWNNGDTVTGPLCQGTGDYVSHTANTLELTNAADRWCVDWQNVGLKAESDTEYTELAPGADDIVWQSANGNPLTVSFSES